VGVSLKRMIEIRFSEKYGPTSHELELYTLGAQVIVSPLRIKKKLCGKEIELTSSLKLSASNPILCR
jgi:hypothetical protein